MGLSFVQTAAAKKLWLGLSALLLAVLAGFVLYGMIRGANPSFDRGRSPTSSVVAQEIVGLLALVAIGATAMELIAVRRGKTASRVRRLLVVDGLLVLVWWVAYVFERAS